MRPKRYPTSFSTLKEEQFGYLEALPVHFVFYVQRSLVSPTWFSSLHCFLLFFRKNDLVWSACYPKCHQLTLFSTCSVL